MDFLPEYVSSNHIKHTLLLYYIKNISTYEYFKRYCHLTLKGKYYANFQIP